MKKRTVKQRKRLLLCFMMADLLLLFLLSFSYAYFTSFDRVTNRFFAKPMDIALYEEKYSLLTEEQRSSLIPRQLLSKDPKVANIAETDVFVFLKVSVPVAETTHVADNGTILQHALPQEVFWLKTDETKNIPANSFHTKQYEGDREYWVELASYEEGTDHDFQVRTYIFAYCVYLKPHEMTETLFDYIELKNIRQFDLTPGEQVEVTVDAFGIQADDLEGIKKDQDGHKAVLTEQQLSAIYNFVRDAEEPGNNG